MDQFHKLRKTINKWEVSIRDLPISSAAIHQKFIPLSNAITELANQSLLFKVSTLIHRDILNLAYIIAQIKIQWIKEGGLSD